VEVEVVPFQLLVSTEDRVEVAALVVPPAD
jgi:hypothetical protein